MSAAPVAIPATRAEIEHYLLDELPSLGPPPRGDDGLVRARRFFAAAGSPQDAAPQVHVVGTAGKGSLVLALTQLLVGAGVSAGAHLSPHVYDLRERFLINGDLPTWDDVAAALAELWPAVQVETDRYGRPPSFFELTNALAWTISKRAGVACIVTEAGIGGRVDATNTIGRADKLTVVMPIGLDHTEILGSDVETVAAEKAGVIGPGATVVMAAQPFEAAADVVRAVAAQQQAELFEVTDADVAAVARTVYGILAERHDWPSDVVPAQLAVPGRLERVAFGDRVAVFDGAHNPLKLAWLSRHLAETGPRLVVAALSTEKDLGRCAAELGRLGDRIICTDFSVTAGDRVVRGSYGAHELAQAVKTANPRVEVEAVVGLERAAQRAAEGSEPVVVVTGSFMVLDPIRRHLIDAEAGQ